MHGITSLARSLVVAMALVGASVAQNVTGTATIPGFGAFDCKFEDAGDPGEASGAGTTQQQGTPPGPQLTIRWFKQVVGDQEWIMMERDEQLLGGICEATGVAWLNSGGAGTFGSWL